MTFIPLEEIYTNSSIHIGQQNLSTGAQLLADVPYKTGEIIWGVILLCVICLVNGLVLWVVGRSTDLWNKPRHLWMACLSFTDLFVAGHKGLELLLLIWPTPELCVLRRTTLGIPYVVNVCVLFLLSLDRFVAVRCPYFYGARASTKHVLIGFILVIVMGTALTGLCMAMGFQDEICRPQRIQLVTMTVILTFCSVLIFLFNFYVLRIAKKQMDLIESQRPKPLTAPSSQASSSVCKTVAKFPHLIYTLCCCHPHNLDSSPVTSTVMEMTASSGADQNHRIMVPPPADKISVGQLRIPVPVITMTTVTYEEENMVVINDEPTSSNPEALSLDLRLAHPITMPFTLPRPIVLSPADLNVTIELQTCHANQTSSIILEETTLESHQLTEALHPLSRAMSMPTLPKSVTLVIPADPTLKATTKVLSTNTSIETDLDKVDRDSTFNSRRGNGSLNSSMHSATFSEVKPHNIKVSLPRSRSFTGGKKFSTHHQRPTRHNILKGFHLTGTPGLSDVWRLMLSKRFAITVLVIMIPTWLFLMPIITMVIMVDLNIDCEMVSELWAFLQIHLRSIVPLQAILDTLIYCCGSKEFRRAFKKNVVS